MLELEILLRDAPGWLLKVIKPLSEHGANIHGIFHVHDRKTADNMVPVVVRFELEGDVDRRVSEIRNALEADQVRVVRVTHEATSETLRFVLVGHVFESDVVDTIRRLSRPGVVVEGMKARFTRPEDVSTVLFTVTVQEVTPEKHADVVEIVESLCAEKDLFLIMEA
ncbi:MAG: allosteric regulator of homoserine dehydrogenase [Promethearchaeota archaeon]